MKKLFHSKKLKEHAYNNLLEDICRKLEQSEKGNPIAFLEYAKSIILGSV